MSDGVMGTGVDGTTIPVGRDEPIMTRKNWGNSRWIAGELFEDVMRRYLPLATNVLEVGSGWTTVVLSTYVASLPRLQVTSLEHIELWYDKVLPHAPNVALYLTPLVAYEEGFEWYDINSDWMPEDDDPKIDLLLVDGPPRKPGEDSRHPAIPVLLHHLAPGCKIILDDATPLDRIHSRWFDEFGVNVVFDHHSDTEDVLVLEYPGPAQVVIETGEKGKDV